MFAQPIIPISWICGDDNNCATMYFEFFLHFSDIPQRGQIGVKSASNAKISQFIAKFGHFEWQNFAVHCKIFRIFFSNFRVDPSLLTPEKKILRGWFKSNLQDKKAVSKRVQDTIQPTEYEHSTINTSPLKSKDWYLLRTTNVMQQQIPTFLKT